MFIDARSVYRDKVLGADLCVVGAGAAGISLARECINGPFRVILLENGGFEYDKDTHCLATARSRDAPAHVRRDHQSLEWLLPTA